MSPSQVLHLVHNTIQSPGVRSGFNSYSRLMRAPKDMHTYGVGLVEARIVRSESFFNIILETIDDGPWVIHFPLDASTDEKFSRLCDAMDSANFEHWDHEMFAGWAWSLGGYADI